MTLQLLSTDISNVKARRVYIYRSAEMTLVVSTDISNVKAWRGYIYWSSEMTLQLVSTDQISWEGKHILCVPDSWA